MMKMALRILLRKNIISQFVEKIVGTGSVSGFRGLVFISKGIGILM